MKYLRQNLKTVNAIWETRNPENSQFQPEYTRVENDELYIEFVSLSA